MLSLLCFAASGSYNLSNAAALLHPCSCWQAMLLQSNRPHLWWQVKATLVHTGGDSSRSVGEALCNYVAKVKPRCTADDEGTRLRELAALPDKVQCRDALSHSQASKLCCSVHHGLIGAHAGWTRAQLSADAALVTSKSGLDYRCVLLGMQESKTTVVEFFLGSVSRYCSVHSSVPVVIVPP